MPLEERHTGICINCHQEKLLWGDNLCSQRCRNEQQRNRKYSICRNCGKHLPKPKRGPMREYCDRKCKSEYQTKQRKALKERTLRGNTKANQLIEDAAKRADRQDKERDQAKETFDHATRRMRANELLLEHLDATWKE
ncbi:hypothetical protein CSQ85_08835 [Bifidobacterium rousetti]|uniref:hypothetical protein n=1 Tax=Bifidobacterium rousetti TaxID=2045439 RepID=UPI00123A0C8C|nr:hypothetical protein [Bifidobacterium rousetti]KAA8818256.1 hypothetical protein CSQ85_08835 [Bifidobacterium rousetti]